MIVKLVGFGRNSEVLEQFEAPGGQKGGGEKGQPGA